MHHRLLKKGKSNRVKTVDVLIVSLIRLRLGQMSVNLYATRLEFPQ